MNDGKRVLARIPNPNAGPAFYTTASGVATMKLTRDFLQIPVRRIFDRSATSNNAVGSECIIMGEASGTQLAYPDTFDAAFDFFSELRERGLRHMKGEESELLTNRLVGRENRVIPGPTERHIASIRWGPLPRFTLSYR